MRVEVPVFKKCCFCVPLRYGLLVWGYIKLLACLFELSVFVHLCFKLYGHYVDLIEISILTFLALALALDIGFSLIFVIGAHKKNAKLLRVYYIATIVTVIIVLLLCLIFFIMRIKRIEDYRQNDVIFGPADIQSMYLDLFLEAAAVFSNLCMQCYLILLVRSEVIKLQAKCQFEFVNNATESECRMKIADNEVV